MLATRALELGLVDKLQTSDDYLMSMLEEADILKLEYIEKKHIMEKLSGMMSLGWRKREEALSDLDKPMYL